MGKLRVVHYINQFFAGIGGEEKADIKPEVREDLLDQVWLSMQVLKVKHEIVATVICGDSYFNENIEEAKARST